MFSCGNTANPADEQPCCPDLRKLFIQVYSRNALSKPYIKQFLSEVNPSDLQFIWTRIFNHLNHLPAQLFDLV